VTEKSVPVNQCSKPSGWLGRFTLRRMNLSHSRLTDWGLTHVSIEKHFTILDVGCGGGRTVSKLAALATRGKVYGLDYSEDSVAVSKKMNAPWINLGRVEVCRGSVSRLPFPDGSFDLVTAVETHFWWPELHNDMREVFRVTKPGGTLLLIAEIYKGANSAASRLAERYASRVGIQLLTAKEHRELCEIAGYSEVEVAEQPSRAWICAVAHRPLAAS